MTVSKNNPVNNYAGDSSATQFDFDFLIEDSGELLVQHTNSSGEQTALTLDVDYSIHEVGNKNGSYITFPIAGSSYSVLAADEVISLSLKLDIEQDKEYANSNKLNFSTLEWSFDYITRILQIMNRLLARAVKIQEGSNIDTDTLAVNLNKVADISDDVSTVAANTSDISTVADDIANVNTVSGSIANVNAVGNSISDVNTVAADLTNVDTVATNISDVNTVAGIASDVSTVSNISSDVTAVKNNASDISDVADDITNVCSVAADLTNIDAVAGDLTNIDAVKNDLTNIDSVAADLTNIDSVAADLTNIDNASANAALSKQYAIGVPSEPTEGSAKYWAAQAAAGQIQADWDQSDNTKKDYIKNKPTKLSNFTDDSETTPIKEAKTLTGLTSTVTELNILDGATLDVNELNILDGATLSTTELNYVDGVTSPIQTQINKKANLICHTDRDFEYEDPKFITADKDNITILAGTNIKLKSGDYYSAASDTSYSFAAVLDTGSVSNGKDYYFYLNNSGELIASLNETAPTGYTSDDVVQIGGAHTLCVSVTSSNAPALPSNSFWSTHPAIGYSAGDIIPNSVWTVAFRSLAKTGNKGQVLIDHYGIEKFWVDIYLQSGTGSATASSYDGTITNSRQPINHQFDMDLVGKKLPTDNQFMIFAEGSNQNTNIAGGAIPPSKLTGGYTDTAGKRMISGFFVECCCGYLWQWGEELGFNGQTNWTAYDTTNRGQSYGMPYVLLFGGDYDSGANGGSWARVCIAPRTDVYTNKGARGVSCHFEKHHK
ncbi:MAG: hypothetical protein DKM22_04315 [Candidatus Melainabacteria bacterium]|nr:MAG: hypothetical protein DKM22_04315 [Candidatus Melainabacteria bacterium]